jgi:hypothetical protein
MLFLEKRLERAKGSNLVTARGMLFGTSLKCKPKLKEK